MKIDDYKLKIEQREQMLTDLCKKYGQEYPEAGFSIGDGWIPTVEQAFEKLNKLNIKWTLKQVKQKFCLLRMYIDFDNVSEEEMSQAQEIIFDAEFVCSNICENCGVKHDLKVPRNGIAYCSSCRNNEIADSVYRIANSLECIEQLLRENKKVY